MTTETQTLGMTAHLKGSLDGVMPQVHEALKAEGFGVLTEINLQETMKKKLDVDFRPYTILGACNPSLAHRALTAKPEIGLLLPCNVVVSQLDADTVEVAIIDPRMMMGVIQHPDLEAVAAEAYDRLSRVRDALSR